MAGGVRLAGANGRAIDGIGRENAREKRGNAMSRRTLHHVSIRVRDVERSRRFYEGMLGVAAAERPDLGFPGFWYRAGSSQIHLIGQEKLLDAGVDPSDPHFALEVDDLPALRRALDAAAIPYLALGDGVLWVRDPDGNTVELRAPETPLGGRS
jgi:catechol 2,3-dioxygenase-like lactoylglutathione lyase family enzyme